jgi:uncharacterized protein
LTRRDIFHITLTLTHDCNMDCAYCYAGAKRRETMSWDVARGAIELAFSFGTPGVRLSFFGGEPTLDWDMLVRATEFAESLAADKGVPLKKNFTTNGTLLTRGRLEWMKSHGIRPDVSMDGCREMHDACRRLRGGGSSFDMVLKGLEAALESFPDAAAVLVRDPRNIAHLAEGVRFLADDVGVERVYLNPNFYAEWSDGDRRAWREGYERIGDFYVERYRAASSGRPDAPADRAGRPFTVSFLDAKIVARLKGGLDSCETCAFGEREVSVAPSGRFYACDRLVGEDAGDSDVCIGSVSDGLDEAKMSLLRERHGSVPKRCRDCPLRTRCQNWCGAVNFTVTGAVDEVPEIVCFHERMSIEVADRVGTVLLDEGCPAFAERFVWTVVRG